MFNNEIYVGRKGNLNNTIKIAKFNNKNILGKIIILATPLIVGFVVRTIATL